MIPAPRHASRTAPRGGRVGDWLEIVVMELRRFFSNLSDWELRRIIELRRRGLGVSEIAKRVYGTSRRRYRVYRLLRRLERLGVFDIGCCDVSSGSGGGDVASATSLHDEPDDRDWDAEALPVKRLGRTQKLVLGALIVHGVASPSMISAHIYETLGIVVSRNAVWHALKRLEARGIVERLRGGRYRIVQAWSRILVENVRVAGRQVWSTQEYGRPARLEEALMLAALRGRVWPVDQIEMFRLGDSGLRVRAERLKSLGWSHTIIYLNRRQGLKIEHRFYAPPTPASPEYIDDWRTLFRIASELVRDLASHALD